MSFELPPKPRMHSAGKVRIAIISSKYNEKFSSSLLESTIEELGELLPECHVDLIRVPGAFEVPVAVKMAIKSQRLDCVIALGVLLIGETDHAELVARSVTESLQQLAIEHNIPIINEVLLLSSTMQAQARCVDGALNRGTEAARAATAMIELFQELDAKNKSVLRPVN